MEVKFFLISLFIIWPSFSWSSSPNIQTPAPLIYLSDNLDESAELGWCIDTIGRGFAERLHAHSCKPHGGDVQFFYRKLTKQILSATYSEKCVEVIGPILKGAKLGLLQCSVNSSKQKFEYKNKEFRPLSKLRYCLVVGKNSRSAGPFMARNLYLAPCDAVAKQYRRWMIKRKK